MMLCMDKPLLTETASEYLKRIGAKGGASKSKAKRDASRDNVAKAQAALAAQREAKRRPASN